MVQGLPAVKWTPENNHKLLQVLVVIHAGTPDYKKIASAFGPEVPSEAIQYRIRTLRKEAAALDILGSNSSPTNSSSTGKKVSSGRKHKAPASEDIDGDEGIDTDDAIAHQLNSANTRDDKHPASKPSKKAQKVINGRITKARKSPRAVVKKNYVALGDPFVGSNFVNSDGEIFPTDHSDCEDSFHSDKGYDAKDEDGQEMEEGV